MDLKEFLVYLSNGAPALFQDILNLLPNAELKTLRLVIKDLSAELFPYLFRRIYCSAHGLDLEVLETIASHERARTYIQEIFYDDTIFDRWIAGIQTYKNRLLQVAPIPIHKVHVEDLKKAYHFWCEQAVLFEKNRYHKTDKNYLETYIIKLPSLKHITILGRSRLTYVDPRTYWDVWQTPRSRIWGKRDYSGLLLDPEPFKPSIGTTVEQSEGIRPMRMLLDVIQRNQGFKIGCLDVNSVGGGQTRVAGRMTGGNQYGRKWLIDLDSLTSERKPRSPSGFIDLHLLLETQTTDLYLTSGIWEELLDQMMQVAENTLQEIKLTAISLDYFFEHSKKNPKTGIQTCKNLRRVILNDCWCSDPSEFLSFLFQETSTREVEFLSTDLDTKSWLSVLNNLKLDKIHFDRFEIRSSRCHSDYTGFHGARPLIAPWNGSSAEIVPWLRGEKDAFPLWQGPD